MDVLYFLHQVRGEIQMNKAAKFTFTVLAMALMFATLTYAWAYGDDKVVWHQAKGCQGGTQHLNAKLEGTCERQVAPGVTEVRYIQNLPILKHYRLLNQALSPKQ